MAVAGPASRAGRALRPPRGGRPRRARLGRRDGLLRHARWASQPDFLGEWLPGMLILGVGAGLTLPDAERRGRRLGAGAALRARHLAELGRAPARRRARRGGPDRDPRHAHAAAGAARLRARLAVRRRLLPGRRARVPRPASCAAPTREPRTRDGAAPASTGAPAADGAAGAAGAAEPRRSRGRARRRRAADAGRLPAQRPGVRRALAPELLERVAALASRSAAPRRVAVPRGRGRGRGVCGARRPPEVLQRATMASQAINTLTRGAVLGELALLSDSRAAPRCARCATASCCGSTRRSFEALLRSEPELALSLTRVLSAQLQASRAIPPARRARPVTIALRALSPGVPLLELADELSRALCAWGRVAVLYPRGARPRRGWPRSRRRRAERELRAAGRALRARPRPGADGVRRRARARGWDEFCLARADRVLASWPARVPRASSRHGAGAGGGARAGSRGGGPARLRHASPARASSARWIERRCGPAGVFAIGADSARGATSRAWRGGSAGRAVGVVLERRRRARVRAPRRARRAARRRARGSTASAA